VRKLMIEVMNLRYQEAQVERMLLGAKEFGSALYGITVEA
jgi:hypothetical protein